MWTPNYEDIKAVQGASCKTKIVKHRFQDHDDIGTTPEDENGIEGAGGAAAAPAAGAAAAAPPAGGEEPAAAAAAAATAAPNPSGKAA
jgi:hypothetical protein